MNDRGRAGGSDPSRRQAGKRTRGGRVTHVIARVGWLVFAAAGVALMLVLAVILGVLEDDPEYDFTSAFLGAMILFAPVGGVLFALVGLGAQFGTRAWLRSAPPVVSPEQHRDRELANQVAQAGLRAGSRWAEHYENCLRAVSGFRDIVEELPDNAAQEWFVGIGETLDQQLAAALRLAKLGDSLEASSDSGQSPSTTMRQVDESLQQAVDAFAQTTEQAASIALELHGGAEFTRVRSQLDMLQQQAPRLHEQ